jgi:hypothetical protein
VSQPGLYELIPGTDAGGRSVSASIRAESEPNRGRRFPGFDPCESAVSKLIAADPAPKARRFLTAGGFS